MKNIVSRITGILQKEIIHIVLIAILGLLIYSNTFDAPFHFDDKANIIKNNSLKDLNNFWPPSGTRWFGFLTFALNYHFGGLNTIGYHVVNLAIHILNAILVYWLVVLTFRTPYLKVHGSWLMAHSNNEPSTTSYETTTLIALFSALLFVAHPIQTQAVTYIVQRFTSLATFFYLLSLVMYIKWRESKGQRAEGKEQKTENRKLHAPCSMLYAISIISAILAMFTKEIAFTLPVIITLYEFMFFKEEIKKRILYLIPLIFTMLIIPLSHVNIDKPLDGLIGNIGEATKELTTMSRWDYLFTQFRVVVTYIRLLFLPINQNVDYDYPIYTSFINPNVFFSFLFLLSIFGLGICLLYKSRNTYFAWRLAAFGIFWLFITLSVESSIIPIKDVIFEHRMYLPDIGAIIAFVSGIFYILRFTIHDSRLTTYASRTCCLLLLASVVIIFSIATYKRNIIWQTSVNLWEDATQKSPNKERPHENLGVAYSEQNRIHEAIKEFETAVQLDPVSAESHYDLGNAYQSQGRIAEAVRELETALNLNPNNPNFAYAYYTLGMYYSAQGRLDAAIIKFQGVLNFNPYSPYAHNGLGNIYLKQGRLNDAMNEFETAQKLGSFSGYAQHHNMPTPHKNKHR